MENELSGAFQRCKRINVQATVWSSEKLSFFGAYMRTLHILHSHAHIALDMFFMHCIPNSLCKYIQVCYLYRTISKILIMQCLEYGKNAKILVSIHGFLCALLIIKHVKLCTTFSYSSVPGTSHVR